ncbi:MAG: carboxymuconolactone decarboxylase family protein [Bdellovibrionales bacterium]
MDFDFIFGLIHKERGGVAKIHSAFELFPQGILAHYTFYKQIILADKLPLNRFEREYLAVQTSKANRCPYCIGHHEAALKNSDLTQVSTVRQKAMDQLSEVLTREPWKANPIHKVFLEAGFTEPQWQHAVMVVAYFNFVNRCAHAMGLEIEENYEETCK